MADEPDAAGRAALNVQVSQFRRWGWLGPKTATALVEATDLRATVLKLEKQRALTTATARTLLRTAFGEGLPSVGGPENEGVGRLHGTRADIEAGGFDVDPVGPKPLSPVRLPHPKSYDEIAAEHVGRLKNR